MVRQAEFIMRSSSEEEVDESDYSEDEESHPSIEMIEQVAGPDREVG